MRRLLTLCAIIGMLAVLNPASGAIYEADFNAQPLGLLSEQPNTDPLPLYLPTSVYTFGISTVDVVASAGDLLNKPVLLDSVPGYLASAAFYNPSQYSSGAFRISWDSLVLSTPVDSRQEQGSVAIVQEDGGGSSSTTWGLKYNTDGKFLIHDATGYQSVGSFSVAISDHFDLYLDLDSSAYELYINSASALTGSLIGSGKFLCTVFHSNGRWDQERAPFAFDNLEVVPIPGAVLLGMLGLSVAGIKLRKSA